MKKVIVGVGLGLATVSQAHAWTGGIEDMRTMKANQQGNVVKVKSSRVECCRLRPVRAHGHAHQTKRIHNGRTYYCTDATAQHGKKQHHVAPRQSYQRNHQQAAHAQRAKRQAMYAAQAKRKALLLAQKRKRAVLIAQQKRRAVQLAQQQRRAAHQAKILAHKKRQAALLIQQKRRAMQLAQQKRQLAQKRALLAQQKQRTTQQQRVVHHQRPVQQQRIVQQQRVVQQHVPQEVVIERYTYPTYVSRTTQPAPAPMIRSAPRISVSQGVAQQSVDYHDLRHSHSRAGWKSTNVVRPAQQSVELHDARIRQQRLTQLRSRQLAAQKHRKHRQHQMHKQHQVQNQVQHIRMAPIAPYVAPAHIASQSVARSHSNGWQRGSKVHTHRMGNMYERYQG